MSQSASLIRLALSRSVVARFLAAGDRGSILNEAQRRQINNALRQMGMDGNGRYRDPAKALAEIAGALKRYGIQFDEPIQRADTLGANGQLSLGIAFSDEENPFNPTSIRNTALAFHWAALDEHSFEVVSYLG